MEIKSPIAQVGCSAEVLFDFVANLENLEGLLPSDQVQAFQLNGDVCQFKVTGGFDVVIKKTLEERPTWDSDSICSVRADRAHGQRVKRSSRLRC